MSQHFGQPPHIIIFSLPSNNVEKSIQPRAREIDISALPLPVPSIHQVTFTPSPPRILPLTNNMIYLTNATCETLQLFLDKSAAFAQGDFDANGTSSRQGDGRLAIPWQCLMYLWMEAGCVDLIPLLAALPELGITELILVVGKEDIVGTVQEEKLPGEFVLIKPGDRKEIIQSENCSLADFNWNILMAMFENGFDSEGYETLNWDFIEDKIKKLMQKIPKQMCERVAAMYKGKHASEAETSNRFEC